MSMRSGVAVRLGWVPVVLAALVACERGPSVEVQRQLEQLAVVSAQKDSLLQEVADNARLVSEISAELAKVEVKGKRLRVAAESPLQASRDSLLEKIRYVAARVNESDARLRDSERRIRSLSILSDSLRATLEATVANLQGVIETQRGTIGALTEQVNGLQSQNAQLAAEKAALADTVATLAAQNNTVYYVVGTKDELLQRGIVVQEGGSRFPFIVEKRGQTVVPARDLEPSEFTAIDKRQVTEIALPEPGQAYRIASRHDVTALATPPDERGKITGTLRIAAPDRFWAASKFLIIVRS